MSNRTPTPEIDRIWGRTETTARWHDLWLNHLVAQTALNPNHPGHGNSNDHHDYRTAAREHRAAPALWHRETDRIEQATRHDLQAELRNLNDHAGATTAHMGLTSHDITDVAIQQAILQSLDWITTKTRHLAVDLADFAEHYADTRLVARTHGQPAQLTTYGHRTATILGPLLNWIQRAEHQLATYPIRPPHGAVGTGADLARVLTGWQPDAPKGQPDVPEVPTTGLGATGSASDTPAGMPVGLEQFEHLRDTIVEGFKAARMTVGLANTALARVGMRLIDGQPGDAIVGCPRCGTVETAAVAQCSYKWHPPQTSPADYLIGVYTLEVAKQAGWTRGNSMDVTRQIYHRSYDLPAASLMVELACIAQTWATDRRLEAMLGLGNEQHDPDQVGSSAMAHKTNPVLSERICSLAAITRSHYTGLAEIAGQGWLEGDVSTSGARRVLLPQLFSNAAAILANWEAANRRWRPDLAAMESEIASNQVDLSSGAVLHWLTEHGVDRDRAHEIIRSIEEKGPRQFRNALQSRLGLTQPDRDGLREVMDGVLLEPIGNVQEQIARVVKRARGE